MKFYIIKKKENLPQENPWDPWYDKCSAMLIRANDIRQARETAAKNAKDEGEDAWLNTNFSTCEEIIKSDEPEVISQEIDFG